MRGKPLVSVIIPAFNAQELIGETIDSILAQTYENLEIIVVDDGSTDRTSDVVSGYGGRVSYYYQNNSGGCAVPRNTGISHSSGEFLCFLDADDLMVPERIASQIEFMERYPEVGLVFCNYRNFNEQGPFVQSHFETCPRLFPQLISKKEIVLENACALLSQENFGITGSFLMRRDLLELETGFEPALRACEDYHFYFRLSRHTHVGVINNVGMLRRVHGNNMSGDPTKMHTEGIRCITLLLDGEKDPKICVELTSKLANLHLSLAYHYRENMFYRDAFREYIMGLYLRPFNIAAYKALIKLAIMSLSNLLK